MVLKKFQDSITRFAFGKEKPVLVDSFYSCMDKLIDETEKEMKDYSNKVLIVTNVASKWGLTKQNYTEFVELSKELREKGLEILAFPCNQFGSQEPGSPEEILKFVEKFDAKDRLVFFEKAHVNGKNTREVFGYLKQELPTEGNDSNDIRWNFAKFLISPDGKPVKRFAPTESPLSFKSDIEELLKEIKKSED